jgi:hypothetical protein
VFVCGPGYIELVQVEKGTKGTGLDRLRVWFGDQDLMIELVHAGEKFKLLARAVSVYLPF